MIDPGNFELSGAHLERASSQQPSDVDQTEKVQMDRRLWVLSPGMFAPGTDSFVVAGLLPEIGRGFDIDIDVAGLMATVYALTYALLAQTTALVTAELATTKILVFNRGHIKPASDDASGQRFETSEGLSLH
jgi:hypothetical protein